MQGCLAADRRFDKRVAPSVARALSLAMLTSFSGAQQRARVQQVFFPLGAGVALRKGAVAMWQC